MHPTIQELHNEQMSVYCTAHLPYMVTILVSKGSQKIRTKYYVCGNGFSLSMWVVNEHTR